MPDKGGLLIDLGGGGDDDETSDQEHAAERNAVARRFMSAKTAESFLSAFDDLMRLGPPRGGDEGQG